MLALFALAALPFLNIAATRFTRRMYPVGLSLQQELADLSGVVEESVAGVRVVKGFGAERLQERNLAVEADDVYDRSIDQARLRAELPAAHRPAARPSASSASSGTAATK